MPTETTYLPTKEVAKLVRKALATRFPGVKFSVRSRRSSIDVYWIDGPTERQVDPLLRQFSGADFDGMIDLAVYKQAWLMPDGTAQLAYRPGTNGSISEYVSDAPHPDATLVRFGADYVFGNRTETNHDAQYQEARDLILARCDTYGDPPYERYGDTWVNNLAHSMVRNRAEGDDWEHAFRYVVLRDPDA